MTDKTINDIAVIGGGAWGTALAQTLAQAGKNVALYARDPGLAEKIGKARENDVYLPGIKLDPRIRATNDPAAASRNAGLALFVVPAQFFRETLKKFLAHLPAPCPVINCAKGIEMATGKLLSEAAADVAPFRAYALLSGPTFAIETAKGLPCALTLATTASAGKLWAETLRTPFFRPYLSHDVTGAEIAGALKNVIAIACGIVEGKKLGQNARAAVMTRGMAEIKRFGLSRGAQAETFLGLSGIGDLTLTCNSMTSRNFSLGAELGQGKKLEDILKSRRTVAEGVATAAAIAGIAKKEKIDMPICAGIDAILHGKVPVDEIIHGLMSRDLRDEAE